MNSNEQHCLYCGKVIKGRIDKKFCDDFCRNSYNNEHNSDANNLMRNINNILRKNRRILKSCIPPHSETIKTKRDHLLQKGYQFPYHTHFYETQKGQVYTFCYEYGFLPLEQDIFLIVHRKSPEKEV
ncbi:MAG TPA: DUF2116 family Zn-ribbon domain-containing protein [Edaphocola sp.]|nr:DUF2116 family Zn-ribbon domain-containing protein [Edaphocola sp.]